MTFLSCLAIGVAFLLAVALLIFAAVLLGWYIPGIIERARQAGGPPAAEEKDGNDPPARDPRTPPD